MLASVVLAAETPAPLAIGSQAPDFELPGIDGKNHRLGEYKADVLAIVFTCNHCPTAQSYEERLKQMVIDFKDKSVDLIAVSPNSAAGLRLDEQGFSIVGDTLEDMVVHAKTYGFNFPYLYDGESQAVSKACGVIATPHLYVFDKARKLRYQGRIDDHEKGDNIKSHDGRDVINALLEGKEIVEKETRVFGCSTKWVSKGGGSERADRKWAELPVTLAKIKPDEVTALAENKTDKLRLINVWATWCGPCVAEFPELVKLNRIYGRRGFELVTLSVDDEANEKLVLNFLTKHHASDHEDIQPTLAKENRTTNNYLFGGESKDALAEALDAEWRGGYPHTVLVAPGGKVLFRQTGEIQPIEIRKAIVNYLGRTYAGRQWGG